MCKQHHDDAHNDKIIIRGYVQTTNGVILDYEILPKATPVNTSKKKYSPEEAKLFVDYIVNLRQNELMSTSSTILMTNEDGSIKKIR